MTTPQDAQSNVDTAPATTEVSVEMPAHITTTTEAVATPETAGDAEPDAATEATEAEPKQD